MPKAHLNDLIDSRLTLREALDTLGGLEKQGQISTSYTRALRSTAYDCVRQLVLARTGLLPKQKAVLDEDISAALPIFHSLAYQAAKRKGHGSPSDHGSRAARFVELVTGERFDRKRCGVPVHAPWKRLFDGTHTRLDRLRYFVQICLLAGHPSPARLPPWQKLHAAASVKENNDGKAARRRASEAGTAYRSARRALLASATSEVDRARIANEFAALPRQLRGAAVHLASEDWVRTRVAEEVPNPDQLTAWEMVEIVAPGIFKDFQHWASDQGPGAHRAPATRNFMKESVQRAIAYLIRAGFAEKLAEIVCLDLLAEDVELSESHTIVNPRVAAILGETDSVSVSLLWAAVDHEAELALARSPVVNQETVGAGPGGSAWITDSLANDCQNLWTLTSTVYSSLSRNKGNGGHRWATALARWADLKAEISRRRIPARRKPFAKNKQLLIQQITYPQLICVAAPIRRRELHRLRFIWLSALDKAFRLGHGPNHPAVVQAASAYFDEALPHLILMLAIEDGMRLKNYTRGRPGEHFQFSLSHGLTDGHPGVLYGLLANQSDRGPCGLNELRTTWSSRPDDPASVKVGSRASGLNDRPGRSVRWGILDRVILWDYLSVQRPLHLFASGRVDSPASFHLEQDLRLSPFALWATNRRSKQPRAARTNLAQKAGQELHRMARILRPGLPDWTHVSGDPRWRALWTIHSTRLLIASYYGGVRKDWDTAVYLTTDEEKTLRDEYVVVSHALNDRFGLDSSHWENPSAYDPWIDRIYYAQEEIDPLRDDDLPLPPGLRERLDREEADWREEQKKVARWLRIRQARPGQAPPS